jgi:HD-GYP domain-containing protein (c-di-GMP phosphodiesterase class II)
MKHSKLVEKLKKRHVTSKISSLTYIRENLLFNLIFITSIIGIVAYIPSVIGSLYIGYYDTVIIDTLFYGWIFYLLFNKKLTYTQKAIMFIVPIWLLSFYLIIRFGIEGAGFVWLLVAPVLTAILLGLRMGIIALVLTSSILLFLGMIIYNFDIIPHVFGETPTLFWSIMSANTLIVITLIMVSSSVIISALSRTTQKLNTKIQELADTQDAMIETVANLAEYRDTDTGYHIERTKEFVLIIAQTLRKKEKYKAKLTSEYIELLYKSAPLHDIGKIGIPDNILLKKGTLNTEEMEIMKTHTTYGRDALLHSENKLGSNSFLNLAAEIAYTHQERWNGSGYPQGLKGEDIPLSARIMAIADVYDALRSKRPYKEPMNHTTAIDFLKKQSGLLFDPYILEYLPEFSQNFSQVYSKKID